MGVIVRNQKTDGKTTEDVEEENSPKDTFHSLRNILSRMSQSAIEQEALQNNEIHLPWILSFASSYGNHLNATIGKCRVDENRKESCKPSSGPMTFIFFHGARVPPSRKPKSVLSRHAANVDYEG